MTRHQRVEGKRHRRREAPIRISRVSFAVLMGYLLPADWHPHSGGPADDRRSSQSVEAHSTQEAKVVKDLRRVMRHHAGILDLSPLGQM